MTKDEQIGGLYDSVAILETVDTLGLVAMVVNMDCILVARP